MSRNILVVLLAGFLVSGLAVSGFAADNRPWQASKGSLPERSTPVGYTDSGAPVYFARVIKAGVPSIGWFTPSMGKAQILESSRTAAVGAFDVWSGTGRWVTADSTALPPDSFSAGQGADGRQVLLARVSYGGWLVPAVFDWQKGAAAADIGGVRMFFASFEVLIPDWAKISTPGTVTSVFVGGRDSDGSDLVPLRAAQGKGLHPGKWSAGSGKGYVSYGGKEIELGQQQYEVFVGTGTWVQTRGSALPLGAIQAGWDDDGSALYMIRAKQNGADALGKFSAARGEAYIPYGGKELKVTSFEVLCYDLSTNRDFSFVLPTAAPAQTAPASAQSAPQTTADTGSAGDWKKAPEIHLPAKLAAARIVPWLGYWSVDGTLEEKERQDQGLMVDAYTYSGQKDEEVSFTVFSESATPGLSLVSPSNTWVGVSPLTGEGDFPAGGSSGLKATLPESGTYALVVSNFGDSAGAYGLRLQGRAQSFAGKLDAKAASVPVEVTIKESAIYTIETISGTFDPTIVIVDKKTHQVLDLQLDQHGRQVSTAAYVDAGQTLIIQVKAASPMASPRPAGAFTVKVRLDGFGS